MRCEEFRHELDETGSAGSPAAREHAAACPACARAAATWAAAQSALRELDGEAPPPFLHARVMAHLRAAERERTERPPRRRLLPARAAGALAALVAVSFAGWMVWQVRPGQPAPAPTAERAKSAERESFAPEPAAPAAALEAAETPARPSERPPAPSEASPRTVPAPQERPSRMPAGDTATQGTLQAAPETELLDTATPARREEPSPASAAAPASPYPAMRRSEPPHREALATREQAPGRAAPAVAGVAAATAEKASPAIPCLLVAGANGAKGAQTPLELPPGLAPAPGEEIALSLHPDGSVALREGDAGRLDLAALREQLRHLGLPPGDYLLRRAE